MNGSPEWCIEIQMQEIIDFDSQENFMKKSNVETIFLSMI